MEGFLTELSGNLYANPNILEAFKKASGDLEQPLKNEIEDIIRDNAKGFSLEDSFKNFMAKNRSKLIQVIFTGLYTANEKGADMVSFINDQLDYLSEKKAMNSYIRILSSGPRYTSYIIALLPLIVMGIAVCLNRNLASMLFTSAGLIVFIYVFLSYTAGFILINRMVNLSDDTERAIS